MSFQRHRRRRVRFENLETRQVLDAGFGAIAEPIVSPPAVQWAADESASSAAAVEAVADQAVGTLTLDAVIPGVQNDLQITLGGSALLSTELSGTIDIGTVTANGVDITGFTVAGGLINASDVSGFLNLSGVSALPLDINPGINVVSEGSFNAAEVGISINDGSAEIPLLGLAFDFSIDPVEGPGSGTGTVVVNSISGRDYDVTVSIPVALELEAAPGIIAGINGNIVASGVVTVPLDPAASISGFYEQIKAAIGSDQVFGDLIVDTKTAVDSGDTSLIEQVYVDVQTTTAELSAEVITAFNEIVVGLSDPEEIFYLHFAVDTVVAELEAVRDFLSGALFAPNQFAPLTPEEFFDAAVLAVQDEVFTF